MPTAIKPIPLSSKSVIQPSKGKELIVGTGGGAYFPKSMLEDFKYNEKLWTYYGNEVEKTKNDYNTKIDLNNKQISDSAKKPDEETQRPWYRRLF